MEPPHPPPPPSGSAQHAITVDASAPLAALRAQIEALCGVVAFRQRLLFGFPPKELGGGGSDGDSTVSLAALGLKTGETLILEENANAIAPSVIAAAPLPTQPSRSNSSSSSSSSSSLVDGNGTSNSGRIGVDGAMVRRVIDSDNSCLFNAFGYVHACDRRAATELRELIAGIVMSDPDTYSEAFLGQANESYCQFIMNPDRWGGAIEVRELFDFDSMYSALGNVSSNELSCSDLAL